MYMYIHFTVQDVDWTEGLELVQYFFDFTEFGLEMGKTVLAEECVQEYIAGLYGAHSWIIGIIVGHVRNRVTSCRIVCRTCRPPWSDCVHYSYA